MVVSALKVGATDDTWTRQRKFRKRGDFARCNGLNDVDK